MITAIFPDKSKMIENLSNSLDKKIATEEEQIGLFKTYANLENAYFKLKKESRSSEKSLEREEELIGLKKEYKEKEKEFSTYISHAIEKNQKHLYPLGKSDVKDKNKRRQLEQEVLRLQKQELLELEQIEKEMGVEKETSQIQEELKGMVNDEISSTRLKGEEEIEKKEKKVEGMNR